jgi:hypothetical protein
VGIDARRRQHHFGQAFDCIYVPEDGAAGAKLSFKAMHSGPGHAWHCRRRVWKCCQRLGRRDGDGMTKAWHHMLMVPLKQGRAMVRAVPRDSGRVSETEQERGRVRLQDLLNTLHRKINEP